jgi:hypothetical protein
MAFEPISTMYFLNPFNRIGACMCTPTTVARRRLSKPYPSCHYLATARLKRSHGKDYRKQHKNCSSPVPVGLSVHPLSLIGNKQINVLQRQSRTAGGVFFYAIRVLNGL